jgi:class 3 adenylate cyclase
MRSTGLDLPAWLRKFGLERYEPAFRDNEITAEILPDLTDADLRELGLPLGPRKTLLKATALLRAPADASNEVGRVDAASTEARPQAECRQLTVMFADLVGSTALSKQLDPEELRAVLHSYQDTCATAVRCMEGHVAKYMGDGVLAYFGWPVTYEDAAERAVKAGLAIIEAVSGLAIPAGQPLAARVGIATGLVVVGDLLGEGAAREESVIGEVPNVSARLQQLTEPGTVVIAESTRCLLGAEFILKDLVAAALRGFADPVRAWQVVSEGPVRGSPDRRVDASCWPRERDRASPRTLEAGSHRSGPGRAARGRAGRRQVQDRFRSAGAARG